MEELTPERNLFNMYVCSVLANHTGIFLGLREKGVEHAYYG
jgi:hypothetical protein